MADNTPASASRFDQALLLLRVAIGFTMAAHGWQKVFIYHVSGITDGFTKMGIPLPGISAPAVSYLELIGGIALVLGLFGRIVPLLLALDMLGAILFAHLKNGFFLPTGFEFTFVLGATLLALAMMGPGRFSIDGMRRTGR